MRFMIIRKADAETEASAAPSEQLLHDLSASNEQMIEAGVMLDGAGLQASVKGARISFSNGNPTITDGPFAEAKELVAGFTIIEVRSKEEAIAWVKKWPPIDGHGNVQLELRQLFSPEDFGEIAVAQFEALEKGRK